MKPNVIVHLLDGKVVYVRQRGFASVHIRDYNISQEESKLINDEAGLPLYGKPYKIVNCKIIN